ETENHMLLITTARYLTNQLLYAKDSLSIHDNRYNGVMEALLLQLQLEITDDFAEYNAKNYQEETRTALLVLSAYAYDHEVSLAARMVLDYISAHYAVSSNDLRRLIPFRRRNQDPWNRIEYGLGSFYFGPPLGGFMNVSLLDRQGGDPMSPWFAALAGNLRG